MQASLASGTRRSRGPKRSLVALNSRMSTVGDVRDLEHALLQVEGVGWVGCKLQHTKRDQVGKERSGGGGAWEENEEKLG
jgi:hypothetical protein